MLRLTIPVAIAMFAAIIPTSPSWADTITSDIRKADSRLDTLVTVSSSRIYLGDLLNNLSKQSGVGLSAGTRDGAENTQIFVSVRSIRLGDCLDGIWSLLSYKGAEYRWERYGVPGKYEYKLVRSLASQKLAQRLSNLTQELFEKHAERMFAAVEAAPSERETIVRAMVSDLFGPDDALTKGLLDSQRCWAGLATFSESIPKDMQLRILRGQEEPLRISTSQLSDKGREFVRSVWAGFHGFNIKADGTQTPLPEPKWLQFNVERGGTEDVSPTLYIEIQSIGGYGYLGGMPLQKAVLKRIREMWLLPGDSLECEDMERRLVVEAKVEPKPELERALETRLKQLSQCASMPILARLPHESVYDPGFPQKVKLSAFLADLQERPPRLQLKWRNGIMLAGYPAWFHNENLLVPLQTVRKLRKSATNHDGYLTLNDIVETAGSLSSGQLKRLGDDFPAMYSVFPLREALLTLCSTKSSIAQLTSRTGIPLTDRLLAVLSANQFLKSVLEQGSFRSIAMQTVEHSERKPPFKEYLLGLITKDGKWRPVTGVMNIKNEVYAVQK